MKEKMRWIIVMFFSLFFLPINVAAEEADGGDDIEIFGLELEKLLNLGSGILALVLCVLTLAAWKRSYNQRLKYVGVAFALFAVKGLLAAHELVLEEWSFIDPVISVFDFAILLAFFVGIIKR